MPRWRPVRSHRSSAPSETCPACGPRRVEGRSVRTAASPEAESRAAGGARADGVSEIRRFFRTNETPIWFVSATAFNLLGIDRWVRNFSFVNYYDSFDGTHPHVFVPPHARAAGLRVDRGDLQLPARATRRSSTASRARGRQGAVPDVRRGDRAARARGRPRGRLSRRRRCATRLDSKIVTTQLGDEAGVPSVPNVLGRARLVRGAARARGRRAASATTSSCRRRTATRARRRSSSPPRPTGTSTPTSSSARSSR